MTTFISDVTGCLDCPLCQIESLALICRHPYRQQSGKESIILHLSRDWGKTLIKVAEELKDYGSPLWCDLDGEPLLIRRKPK